MRSLSGFHFTRWLYFGLALVLSFVVQAEPTEVLPPGFRPVPPGVHALVGGRVVVKPGQTLTNATIIIRDGYIQTVGADVTAPPEARVWDMNGLTIYPGFIDACLTSETKGADSKSDKSERNLDLTAGSVKFFGVKRQLNEGPVYEVSLVHPEHREAETYHPDAKSLEKLRELGFTAGNFIPDKGIFRGSSVFVALSDADANRAIIKPDVFQHITYDTQRHPADVYPESLMGTIAAVRQTIFDAQHYALDQADFAKHPTGRARPAYNLGMESLAPVVEKKMRVMFDPQDALMVDRSTRVAHELNIDFCFLSCGQEWRRPEFAKEAGVPFVVPLNFPTLPKMPQEDDWNQITLDQLRAWDWAPENPAVLQNVGAEIALTTHGLEDKKDFRKNLRLALDRGLTESNALAALTIVPAQLCGLEAMLGTIEPGKQANLTIVDGTGYFDENAKVRSVWIDGKFYRIPTAEEKEKKEKSPKDGAPSEGVAKTDSDKAQSPEEGEPHQAKETMEKPATAKQTEKAKAESKPSDKEAKQAKLKALQKRVARSPLEGRGVLTNAPIVLVRNATIWTCGPQGIITNADLLVVNGKIAQVGKVTGHLPANQTMTIDGTGLNITPGLIDCHSHSMVLGDVNEGTIPSSAMVRIGDVINSETQNIYEQLAGGLTMAHVLHGSANPIGGQNCLIKLRDGETPEELKFQGALGSIKFALGENVKQSNWGDKYVTRFPQTRMGVRTFYANRFTAAQEYLKAWDDYKKKGGLAPRRDLELEALGEILQGTRLIHCHSYRQDEILMLMRLMEQFHVKIGTFQHVLEGYKVADEIAKHGAGGSTFADWWAYKFEVYDAIPYNGSLMRERGVVVSFNSDSSDLARRLNLEATKAVKFGNTPEPEALKFVTVNPAKQLRVDDRVGSLEVGKDGDFVIWSKNPLDSFTVCQQTWIDGKKYFDIALAPARAAALAKERADLLAKAKKLSHAGGGDDDSDSSSDNNLFFQRSLEHEYDGIIRHCTKEENE